jgi:magnesium-transporting ATPase (P-type)
VNPSTHDEPSGEPRAWHGLPPRDVEDELGTGPHGLSADEVAQRQLRGGPNRIEDEPPPHALVIALRQFRSPLITILLVAACATILLGEYVDAAVIAAVLAINAVVGFTQERRAEGAVRALMQLVVPRARVIREGHEREIDSVELVVGDAVLLEPGSRVPADLRLTHTTGLQIDESLLTGESLPVTKTTLPVESTAVLADRSSMAFTGSVVTSGRGRGAVVAIGGSTELGGIAGLIRGEQHGPTPLQQQMSAFARIVAVAVGIAALIAFVSGVALDAELDDMFLTAVALAVAAIPEGLPVAVTITLALGVRRMAHRHAIIRRLHAVETLGSTTVIGSDKTGTLTQNRMQVEVVWADGRDHTFGVDAAGVRHILDDHDAPAALERFPVLRETLLCGVLANEANAFLVDEEIMTSGDPTEVGLLLSGLAAGIELEDAREAYPLFAEIPFEPELRYSASIRQDGPDHRIFVKGAPERLTEMCSHLATADGPVPLDPGLVHQAVQRLAAGGLRVLAMAAGEVEPRSDPVDLPSPPQSLQLLGLQGLHDPPRPGARDAIAQCHESGIRVIMITGDHAATAGAIATDLGLLTGEAEAVVTGSELGTMDDDQLDERIEEIAVYARVSPEDKLRVVRALEARGEVVAVTGDGVNDAPALRAASIGIAMGRSGTDVAREASEMVLTDDDFVSITAAIEEGRITFDNIRNVTFFLVSTGAATILSILVAVWAQWPLLLLPAQLLWLNLVTNGLQDVALAFEPGSPGVLRRRPRAPHEGVLSRVLWERVIVSGVTMAAGTLVLFRWELDRSGSLVQAQSVALTTLVVFMAFHAGNSRSAHRSVLQVPPLSNPFLFVATVAALGAHIAALYAPPTQYVLRVAPIDLAAWWRLVAVATSILVVVEAHKALRRPATDQGAREVRRETPVRR